MLSNAEKNTIRKMRKNGMGYKAIATAVGKTRDHVRDYCRTANLTGTKGVVYPPKQPKQYYKSCGYCGKEINTTKSAGRKKRFCSDLCRRKWWRDNPQHKKKNEAAFYKFTCIRCGKDFLSYGNKNRKYCGRYCCIQHRYYD